MVATSAFVVRRAGLYAFVLVAIVYVSGAAAESLDATICATCHPDVWETYRHTGMARSFYRPTANDIPASNSSYYHSASDTYFSVVEHDGRYFERQVQIGFGGKRTEYEKTIDFVIGSGNHVRTFLHKTSQNTLLELPLAWYSEKGGYWAMNPGYDRANHQGFRRAIDYDCMFCHNAYPAIPRAHEEPRSTPVYLSLPSGIDCQRCHGAGHKHIELARKGAPVASIREAIVNPARLTTERQLEVCMQCHLETTSSALPASIVRYERKPFSYQPGQALGDFMLHFDHAPGTGHDDKFEISGSAYRLRRSACFLRSAGRLTCTTCHNPHQVLKGERAAQRYNTICLNCHASAIPERLHAGHNSDSNCVGCHMPKRRTDDVVHAVMTDHWIQRRPPARDLIADIPEGRQQPYRGEVRLYYPASLPKPQDELYVAIAQLSQGSNVSEGIARLSAAIAKYQPAGAEYYLQLADALSGAGRYREALPVYEQALRREPESVPAHERLALLLISLGQIARAEEALKWALQRAADAPAWAEFGLIEQAQGKISGATAGLEKAIQLDPDMVEAYNSLGTIRMQSGDTARAETALRDAIRVQPNNAASRNNLANLLASTDRLEEALLQYQAALRYGDNYSGARYNYALTLVRMQRLDEAKAQLVALLRADPHDSDAHELLGDVLVREGHTTAAIEHYREVAQNGTGAVRARARTMLRKLSSPH